MPRSLSPISNGERALYLAIETSNPSSGAEVGVGEIQDGVMTVLAIEKVRDVGRHEDDLLPALERACAGANVRPRQIRVVAVSVGPGGYTSLRVACAAGKMVAEASGGMCVSIPTATSVAISVGSRDVAFAVCLAGKDGSAHVTVFPRGWKLGNTAPVGTVTDADGFPFQEVEQLIGDRHVPESIRARAAAAGLQMVEPRFSAATALRVAGVLPTVDPALLTPIYPREPDAVTLWRKRMQEK